MTKYTAANINFRSPAEPLTGIFQSANLQAIFNSEIYVSRCITRLQYFLIAALLSACQILPTQNLKNSEPKWLTPGLLNSQRIELKFGSYGVEILAQEKSRTRLSNLYSMDNSNQVTRTLAYTIYEQPLDESLKQAHQQILAGSSIGSTLKQAGFQVKKDFFFLGEINVPHALLRFLAQIKVAAVIYDLKAIKDGKILRYCTILEAYDPEFINLEQAQIIYNFAKSASIDQKTQGILQSFEQTAAGLN